MRFIKIILLIYFSIAIALKSYPQRRLYHNIGPWRKIIDTSNKSCNYSFFGCGNSILQLFNVKCIDSVWVGNITSYCWIGKNKTNKLIELKYLHLESVSSNPDFGYIRLAGLSNVISYFECQSVFFSRLASPTVSDTLDFGNAKKAFIRSFQLPVVKRMKVIRHHRLDTILTNDSTDYYISFHGRRVFLKTYLQFKPLRK